MRRLHPATVVVVLVPKLQEALKTVIPVLIGSVFSGHHENSDLIAGAIGLLTGVGAIGAYWTTRFNIEPDHVVHKSGWIFRKDRRIPLAQIQNVNLRQNVLERLFKVATVDVETAMGHGRDLKLSVLSLAEAERFREELLGAAHLTGRDRTDEPLVRLNRHDLILGGLTDNHIVQTIILAFGLGGPAIGGAFRFLSKLPPFLAGLGAVGLIMLLLIAGWLWGVVAYILKYGNFVVRREEHVFRISHGLLGRFQTAVRPSRIEFANLSVTIPQRLMYRATLRVGTASSFGEAGVLAPVALFVDRHVAQEGIADVIPGLDLNRVPWRPFHPVFYRAAVVRCLLFLSALALLAWGIGLAGASLRMVVWVMLGLLGGASLMRLSTIFLAQPENSFAITDDAIVVRQGYFHQTVLAMPIDRLENAAVTQPRWWRRWGAVHLSVQGMKHHVHLPAVPESAAEGLLERWRTKLAQREAREALAETLAQISGEEDDAPSVAQGA